MKRIYNVLFVTILIFLIPVIAGAECNIMIDGEMLFCYDANGTLVEPFVHEGTTYVPVRAVAQAFDTTVTWDQETKTVHLGETGGEPVLGEEINIYYNGEEYICSDVNGNRVFPILREGTTYLPIRSMGSLFGKSIYWDNFTQTATLTTLSSEAAADYLSNSITNTAALGNIDVNLTVHGATHYNGMPFSEREAEGVTEYSNNGFSLNSILPENYKNNMAYLGQGSYFMVIPSTRFISDQQLATALENQQTPTEYSSLYIYISTKGGYVTDVELNFSGKAYYSGIVLDQTISVKADLNYPEGFEFPITPYPDKPLGENEKPVSATTGENSDSDMINSIVKAYVENLVNAKAHKIFELTHPADYASKFSNKNKNQVNTEFNTISKSLAKLFENADGTFTLDAVAYVDATEDVEAAAKAEIAINIPDGDETKIEDVEIRLVKKDGKWYLDINSAMELYNK